MAKTEPTPQMLSAGVASLLHFNIGMDFPEKSLVVRRIYQSMEEVRKDQESLDFGLSGS